VANDVAKPGGGQLERVLIQGDLSQLTEAERANYYMLVCESVGLNPLTRPFQYLELSGKLVLYATKDCTDQLRKIQGVSLSLVAGERVGDVYRVVAKAVTADGRSDESTGAVPLMKEDGEWATASNGKRYFKKNGKLIPLTPEEFANALMKSETKAKRRVTLSICGLGKLDETEVEDIPDARVHVHPSSPKAIAAPAVPAVTAEQVARLAELLDQARPHVRPAILAEHDIPDLASLPASAFPAVEQRLKEHVAKCAVAKAKALAAANWPEAPAGPGGQHQPPPLDERRVLRERLAALVKDSDVDEDHFIGEWGKLFQEPEPRNWTTEQLQQVIDTLESPGRYVDE
jgi:hypothetical protein